MTTDNSRQCRMQQFSKNFLHCELLLPLQNIKFCNYLEYIKHSCHSSHSSVKNQVTWRRDWWNGFCSIIRYSHDRSGERNQVLPSLQVMFLTRIILLCFSWNEMSFQESESIPHFERELHMKKKSTGNPGADNTVHGPWKDAQRHYLGRIKPTGMIQLVQENCLLLFGPPEFKETEFGVCLIVNKCSSTERITDLHNHVSLLLETAWAKRGNSW